MTEPARDTLTVALLKAIRAGGAKGVSPNQLADLAPSRSTLNRRLAELARQGEIRQVGAGRATRYVGLAAFSVSDVEAYFSQRPQERPYAPFQEQLLGPVPQLDILKAERCTRIQALVPPLDGRFFSRFIIDLSWASSLLEGSTYTDLDTQALIEYGQKNKDKPTEDAVLVLNHKNAANHLWKHRDLTFDNCCAVHALLTDDHALDEIAQSDHFLPQHQRGRPREFEDVNLAFSAYMPPFRPGTGFIAEALHGIVATAGSQHPVQAALFLMTRIPYLQAFANGNKRVSRLMANAPLLSAGLLPISFADMDKAAYIRGMAAFYELGFLPAIEQCFLRGYVSSVIRSSLIPAELRVDGVNTGSLHDELLAYVQTGAAPRSSLGRRFVDLSA